MEQQIFARKFSTFELMHGCYGRIGNDLAWAKPSKIPPFAQAVGGDLTVRLVSAMPALCADAHGFSRHAAVRCGTDQRWELEQLCRAITRPAMTNPTLTTMTMRCGGLPRRVAIVVSARST